MDDYQRKIKPGEPVFIFVNIPAMERSCTSIGFFVDTYPAGFDHDYSTESLIRPSRFIYTDKGIEVDEKWDMCSKWWHHSFIISDQSWAPVDPESSIYKIIMFKESCKMFNMHQEILITDGELKGKTGFINGIHVDPHHDIYTVRLTQENENDRIVELEIPGWCLTDYSRKAEETHVDRNPSSNLMDQFAQFLLSSKMNPNLDDFVSEYLNTEKLKLDSEYKKVLKVSDIKDMIRSILKSKLEERIDKIIQEELEGPIRKAITNLDVQSLLNHTSLRINIRGPLSHLVSSGKEIETSEDCRLEHFDEEDDDD